MFITQLKQLIYNKKTKYTIQELLDQFESNNIPLFLVLSTFLTSIPLPPLLGGFETIPGGVLTLILALEGLIGLKTIYIPSSIKNVSIDISYVQKLQVTKDSIQWVESHITPNQYQWVFSDVNEKIMYLLIIPLALLMIIPIIFTDLIPSQAIMLMALAWLVSDGLFFMIMLVVSFFIIVIYALFFIIFAKFLYRTRRTWTFGLWK
jgi:hypothetical protein